VRLCERLGGRGRGNFADGRTEPTELGCRGRLCSIMTLYRSLFVELIGGWNIVLCKWNTRAVSDYCWRDSGPVDTAANVPENLRFMQMFVAASKPLPTLWFNSILGHLSLEAFVSYLKNTKNIDINIYECSYHSSKKTLKTELRGLSPRGNYTNRAISAFRRS
jgi:hypothetical protein